MPKFMDLTGRKFGSLTVVSQAEKKYGKTRWNCVCECGKQTCTITNSLTSGRVKSCGCKRKPTTTHGKSDTQLYWIWTSMKQRCTNPKNKRYSRYGARGINVCEAWADNFQSFYNWSMSNGYKIGLSIDRIDNEKGYSPDNCKWVPMTDQAKRTNRIIYFTFNGVEKLLGEWCRETGFDLHCIEQRYRNMKKRGEEIKFENLFYKGNRTFKKVLQYTTGFELVNEWNKLSDAEVFGYHHSLVSDCCRGKRKSAYGYIWRYAEG